MEGTVEIAVPMLSRIANFDDFDPLAQEPSVRLTMIPPGKPIPASAALIILPGTKATIADLEFLRAQGWDIDIAARSEEHTSELQPLMRISSAVFCLKKNKKTTKKITQNHIKKHETQIHQHKHRLTDQAVSSSNTMKKDL